MISYVTFLAESRVYLGTQALICCLVRTRRESTEKAPAMEAAKEVASELTIDAVEDFLGKCPLYSRESVELTIARGESRRILNNDPPRKRRATNKLY